MRGKYYITTPVYYVNAKPHIGHAYTQIACDSMSRFLRQNGCDVLFMTGTDEHGEKIEKATLAKGMAAGQEKKFVDSIMPHFTKLWEKLDIKYDRFIRTTDDYHEETVRYVLQTLFEKGAVYKGIYKGWFCTPCEMFWSHTQAPDGVCPDCKRALENLDEENYFFKLSEYQNRLIKAIENADIIIKPDMRRNEVLSFLNGNALQDLCISRSKERLKWGIELPFDKNFVSYVWVDALINYISGIGYPKDVEGYKNRWPADMHVIGKDIIKHHAVYWPIMLFALGEKPPRKIFAHGWWVVGGNKMSKSKGNVVDPYYLIDEQGYSVDAIRYFLLSQVRFGWDGSFSEELFIEKYNSDLANDLGNLLSRSLSMVEKYFDGVVPDAGSGWMPEEKDVCDLLSSIRQAVGSLSEKICSYMDIDDEGPDFQAALKEIWAVVDMLNKFVEASAPWKHAKSGNKEALGVIMDTLVQGLGVIIPLLYPCMPSTAKKMWEQTGLAQNKLIETFRYNDIKWGIIPAGTKINKGTPTFPRLEKIK